MLELHSDPAGRSLLAHPILIAALSVGNDDALGYECALPFFHAAGGAPTQPSPQTASSGDVQVLLASRADRRI